MARLRVHNFSVSLDGFGAGPRQREADPLGAGGRRLHEWVFETRHGRAMIGEAGGTTGVDDAFIARGEEGVGATLMGRNMFGPVRGEWGDEDWNGWWGDEPPYHHPVFVLTHHARPPLEMRGGTTFHFVTEGLDAAVEQALGAAGSRDVRVGGGVSTVRRLLQARRLDEVHLVVVPVLLGSGERLLGELDGIERDYEAREVVPSDAVLHVVLARRG